MQPRSETEALDRFRHVGATKVEPLMIHAPHLPVSDIDISYLSVLPNLEHLVLTGTEITDECMPMIGRCRELTLLDISDNAISDLGAAHLHSLTNLTTLGIYGTQVTDATADLIASLPRLKMLNISHTAITDAGLLKFIRPVGFCAIETHNSKITQSGVEEFARHCPSTMLVTDDGLVGGETN